MLRRDAGMEGSRRPAPTKMNPLYWLRLWTQIVSATSRVSHPWGVDLIPVYADDSSGVKDEPGTVFIDSSVENNLGVKTAKVNFEALSPRIETVGRCGVR